LELTIDEPFLDELCIQWHAMIEIEAVTLGAHISVFCFKSALQRTSC
jgi:hypothetical protein